MLIVFNLNSDALQFIQHIAPHIEATCGLSMDLIVHAVPSAPHSLLTNAVSDQEVASDQGPAVWGMDSGDRAAFFRLQAPVFQLPGVYDIKNRAPI